MLKVNEQPHCEHISWGQGCVHPWVFSGWVKGSHRTMCSMASQCHQSQDWDIAEATAAPGYGSGCPKSPSGQPSLRCPHLQWQIRSEGAQQQGCTGLSRVAFPFVSVSSGWDALSTCSHRLGKQTHFIEHWVEPAKGAWAQSRLHMHGDTRVSLSSFQLLLKARR